MRGRGAAAAAIALLTLALAACTSPSYGGLPTRLNPHGGTVHVLLDTEVAHWDPQRIGASPQAPEVSLASRLFMRTLTAQAPAFGSGTTSLAADLVPDLATTLGDVSDNGRTWTFTLSGGGVWQDERQVTCDDVKYGVSRNFARRELTGGTSYALSLLDIPRSTDSSGALVSAYQGPYSGVGQALFDRAVTCLGDTITFHLRTPTYDFNQVVAQPAFAPVRKDYDLRGAGNFSVFSDGPYMLEGDWVPGHGARFVRTRSWASYLDPVRLGLPDVIDVREGIPATTALQRIVDDTGEDRDAVTFASAPPALAGQIIEDPSLGDRTSTVDTPVVHYLAPSPSSSVMRDADVRRALAMSTDRDAYAQPYGGATLMRPTGSVLVGTIPGSSALDVFGVGLDGDAAKAKAVLKQSGLTLPVRVRVAYRQSAFADSALEGLRRGWERAGFSVSLTPLTGDAVPAPSTYDVLVSTWAAAWPSASTVIPPLFGSRSDLQALLGTAAGASLDTRIESALAMPDLVQRTSAWTAVDQELATQGLYVALAQQRSVYVHGSSIEGYSDNPLLGGTPDLARIRIAPSGPS